jgi:folate-binding protein YgfZ
MTSSELAPTLSPLPAAGSCALPHLGVIAACGEDAAHFLHNQLTQDFALLDMQHARLAAFCNAKGRMQASMVGFKTSPQEVLLVLRADLLAQTLKRLSMFVLRAKVKLKDVSAEWQVLGAFGSAPLLATPWTLTPHGSAWQVALYPAAGVSRRLHLLPANEALVTTNVDLQDWLLGEVLSGVADVQAATYEAFVPQMLNYESVDGVNFKKGCYPGQEVVARSQFRGILKRRTYVMSSPVALQAGVEIFSNTDSSQPAGLVAQAVSHEQHGHWALVCLQTAAEQADTLYPAGSPDSPLRLHPLPYALREDI